MVVRAGSKLLRATATRARFLATRGQNRQEGAAPSLMDPTPSYVMNAESGSLSESHMTWEEDAAKVGDTDCIRE